MSMEAFLARRETFRKERTAHKVVASSLSVEKEFSDLMKKINDIEPGVRFQITINGQSGSRIDIVHTGNWSTNNIGNRLQGDHYFISSVNPAFTDIAIELVKHIRGLHPEGILVQGENPKRFTNYQLINGDQFFNRERFNFVSFVPLQESIKINLIKGNYSFFDHIKQEDDGRYPFIRISDKFQLQSAMDAIEYSMYNYIDNISEDLT